MKLRVGSSFTSMGCTAPAAPPRPFERHGLASRGSLFAALPLASAALIALSGCSGAESGASPDGAGASGSGGAGGSGGQGSVQGPVSLVGSCDPLQTEYVGDDACMQPPPPGLGFQIHIGPDDYTDPDQIDEFIMLPGEESSECYMKKTPNDVDIFYSNVEISGRPGTHHIINTLLGTERPDGWGPCELFFASEDVAGSLGGASRAHMPLKQVAEENKGLGTRLAAAAQGQFDMHYFNTTTAPILREFWLNVWYIDEEDVTQTPTSIMGLGGLSWITTPIPPGTHETYQYSCEIPEDGRITSLIGHTHAHGIRETAWIKSGSDQMKVFEQYDYAEPQIFDYDSVIKNPGFSASRPGAHSGILSVNGGNELVWECEVLNDSDVALRYVNDVFEGEMCNIWGASVGTGPISCVRF